LGVVYRNWAIKVQREKDNVILALGRLIAQPDPEAFEYLKKVLGFSVSIDMLIEKVLKELSDAKPKSS
jgi:hypothetical protein